MKESTQLQQTSKYFLHAFNKLPTETGLPIIQVILFGLVYNFSKPSRQFHRAIIHRKNYGGSASFLQTTFCQFSHTVEIGE